MSDRMLSTLTREAFFDVGYNRESGGKYTSAKNGVFTLAPPASTGESERIPLLLTNGGQYGSLNLLGGLVTRRLYRGQRWQV